MGYDYSHIEKLWFYMVIYDISITHIRYLTPVLH